MTGAARAASPAPVALVLGTNAGQADLIRELKAEGWAVHGCAHRAGGSGEPLLEGFHLVDIRDAEAVRALAERLDAKLVYSCSSDVAVPTVVKASKALGLPHYFEEDIVELFDKKHKLRAWLNERGLSAVPFATLNSLEEVAGWSSFPCIVKPSDSQGQRGVVKIERREDLNEAVLQALDQSPTRSAIIEAFLEGVEISCNVLISQGRFVACELSERLVHGEHALGVPLGHLVPIVHASADEVAAADQLVRDIVAALGVEDGVLYVQMKLTSQGPRVIEIAPRHDGCHMWRLIKAARGFDLMELAVRGLVGERILPQTGRDDGAVYELMFQQMPPGAAFSAEKFPIPSDALYHEYRYAEGDLVSPINGRLEVVGYYVRRAPEYGPVRPAVGLSVEP